VRRSAVEIREVKPQFYCHNFWVYVVAVITMKIRNRTWNFITNIFLRIAWKGPPLEYPASELSSETSNYFKHVFIVFLPLCG
jgi:hypothetical protein